MNWSYFNTLKAGITVREFKAVSDIKYCKRWKNFAPCDKYIHCTALHGGPDMIAFYGIPALF